MGNSVLRHDATKFTGSRIASAPDNLPAPLAGARAAALKEKSSHGRQQAAYAYLAAWLKTAAAGQVTVYRRLLRPLLVLDGRHEACAKLDETVRLLRRPSDGQWLSLVREHARYSWPDGETSPLAAFNAGFSRNLPDGTFDALAHFLREAANKPVRFRNPDQLLGEIIAFRNAAAHSRPLTDDEAARGGPLLFEAADWFCRNLPPLGEARLAIRWDIDGVPPEERQFRETGAGQPWLLPTEQIAPASGDGGLWLWWRKDESSGFAAPLAPVLERLDDDGRERFLFLNRVVLASAPSSRGGGVIVSRAEYSDLERACSLGVPHSHAAWTDLFNACGQAAAFGDDADDSSSRIKTAGALRPGETVGPYELLEELGHGGMGVVYRARHRDLDRFVALKIVTHALWGDEDAEARFRREIRALSLCDHPNVVRIFDSGRDGPLRYYTMEYISGSTLADAGGDLSGKPASEGSPLGSGASPEVRRSGRHQTLARLFAGAARGLQHLHDRGIVHRDVKPANLMLASDANGRRLVVMDLGLARLAAVNATLITGEGMRIGTLKYMAPEQAGGGPDAAGAATDVYGLGAVLYEVLCRRAPFEGQPAALARKIMNELPADPRAVNPAIPRDLARIVMAALAKEPGKRHASAGDMAEELERFASNLPLRMGETSAIRAVGLFFRNKPLGAWVRSTAAAMTVATGVLGWLGWRGTRDNPPESASAPVAAVAEAERPSGEPDRETVTQNIAPLFPPPGTVSSLQPAAVTVEAAFPARGVPEKYAVDMARRMARRQAVIEGGAEIFRRLGTGGDAALVKETVLAHGGDMVSEIEWLKYPDGKDSQLRDGMMRVRLRARLDRAKAEDAARAAAEVIGRRGAPVVALWVEGEAGLGPEMLEAFVGAVEAGLLERGIALADREAVRQAVNSERTSSAVGSRSSPQSVLPVDFAIEGIVRSGGAEVRKLHNTNFVTQSVGFRFSIDDKRLRRRAATVQNEIELPPRLAAQAEEKLRWVMEEAGTGQGLVLAEEILKTLKEEVD